jgi:methionine synthase I (cobalamin-dependent)
MEYIRRGPVLFDGGMGSMLIAAGLGEKEIPEQWNFLHPEIMIEIHTAYLEAGAEVIQTNTFGATAIKLAASEGGRGLDPSAVNEKAAELALEALRLFSGGRGAGENAMPRFVAGDIGPVGEFFPPMGKLTAERARAAFREQAVALNRGGVDLFLIETMYDLREAVEALRAVREVSNKPVIVELTMDLKPRGYFTLVGDAVSKAVEVLIPEGADVIGANCTIASEAMVGLVPEFRRLTRAPLLFQPNAGRPEISGGAAVYRQTPGEFAADLAKILDAGADCVGGCCGTTPDFIRAARAMIDAKGRASR